MRILQVGKYYYPEKGGIETHIRTLSAGLRARAEVDVVVAGKSLPGPEYVDGIRVERLPVALTALGAPIYPQLISRLRRADSDIVHVHLPNPWAVIAYLLSGCQCPLVVSYHSDIVRQSYIEPAFRPILFKFLQRASLIICASEKLVKHSPTLQAFQDRCVVVPYGVEVQPLIGPDSPPENSIAGKYKRPIILAVGRLVYYKGFEYLISAMTEVDASLIIIGDGPLKRELLQLATDRGVAAKVTILDRIDDVQPFYQAAEIFVLPSTARSEAFGIVQIEAMAAGKPVINTDLPSGVPFVSPHGHTGLTVPPANPQALAAAINTLLGDPELRQRYGSAARLRVQQHFNVADMVSRTLHLYRTTLASSGALARSRLGFTAAAGD